LKENQVLHLLPLRKQEFIAGESAGPPTGDNLGTLPRRKSVEERRGAHEHQVLTDV